MKLDAWGGGAAITASPVRTRWGVSGETDRLTDVMLCRPHHLAPVPCCSVTRESLRDGFQTSAAQALAQHRALESLLEASGVRCHMLPADPGHPDLCFTRDAAVMTPWGLLPLAPSSPHRAAEPALVRAAAAGWNVPVLPTLAEGRAEGGDIAVIRPGLVAIGCSGERTDEAGAAAVGALFRRHGWEVLVHRFDPHFLHLDTQFCMVEEDVALACVEVLDDGFLIELERRGIELVPVSYKESRRLGCNILSLGEGRLISTVQNERVNGALMARGFQVDALDLSQFTACGGGVHCLTMPLARV